MFETPSTLTAATTANSDAERSESSSEEEEEGGDWEDVENDDAERALRAADGPAIEVHIGDEDRAQIAALTKKAAARLLQELRVDLHQVF